MLLLVLLMMIALAALAPILPAAHGQTPPAGDDGGGIISSFSEAGGMNGTISSLLLPAATGGGMMDGSMSETRQQAMRFSMAQDVTWVLSGNWSLSDNGDAIEFDAAFTKVATDGTMRHTHRIANLTLPADGDAVSAFVQTTMPATLVISGNADVYFNDELAWEQAGIGLRVHNGVLVITLDGIDSHFHDMPIYGVVAMPK